MKIGFEEDWPVSAFFFLSLGLSLLTRGLILESFDNSTSDTSKLLFFGLRDYFIHFA